jgi:hypothetical protein
MRKATPVVALMTASLALSGCGSGENPPPVVGTKNQALDAAKTLWMASEVPQVGAIIRLSFADEAHTLVARAAYDNIGVAELYKPVPGYTQSEATTLGNKASVNLGLSFLARGAPSVGADAHDIDKLTLSVTDEKVSQWKSVDDLQDFLRRFDGGKAQTHAIHELFAKIKDAADQERKTKAVTPYWVLTKVFTGKSVEYSATISTGANAQLSCGGRKAKCTISAVKLTGGLSLDEDKQHIIKSDDRPIFVVIKPLTENSKGNITIETDPLGPGVISD